MKDFRGFIALSTVLIVSAVVLSIAVTVSLLSIGEGQASYAMTRGEETLSFVEGCGEDALLKLRASPSYTGGNITRPEGTCQVSVSSVGNNYTLTVTTTATTYVRTVRINVTRSGLLTITSWEEV